MKVEKICYVCGFHLDDYPYDKSSFLANESVICPCCGTHYGLDDLGAGKVEVPESIINAYNHFGDGAHKKIIEILREHWIASGMKWWSTENPFHKQPENWNPYAQLKNIPTGF